MTHFRIYEKLILNLEKNSLLISPISIFVKLIIKIQLLMSLGKKLNTSADDVILQMMHLALFQANQRLV